MNLPLFVLDSPDVSAKIDRLAFKKDDTNEYMLDLVIMDFLDIAPECPVGYRPLAVHIVPYTVVDEEIIYYAFAKEGLPSIYVSFLIKQDDFVSHNPTDPMMSLCSSIVGKIVILLDQPHIDMKLDTKDFKFPATIKGEFVWAFEVKGDNNQVVDEMVAQLGTVMGRVAKEQVINGDILVNPLSNLIVTYKAEADDIVI